MDGRREKTACVVIKEDVPFSQKQVQAKRRKWVIIITPMLSVICFHRKPSVHWNSIYVIHRS